mmetsp:Transcript_402/g.803  ORF Transcript_402/g.803 Transcript_402/m.803 type:complete len:235 (-) Transcript_402:299-1003(-)
MLRATGTLWPLLRAKSATSRGSTSAQRVCILKWGTPSRSHLVSPSLSTSTAAPDSAAETTSLNAEYVETVEPTTMNKSVDKAASLARRARSSGTMSPKKVTLGLRIPTPQTSHAGTLNFCKSCLEMRISVSPSGRCCAGSIRACKCALPTPAWRSHQWFSATSLRCSATRGVTERQCMHPTRWLEPCSSITASLPAFWCKPSTFCVTKSEIKPVRCMLAIATCPAFALARAKDG